MSAPDPRHPRGVDSDLAEHCVDSRDVYRGHLLHVREDRVRLPDGADARREWVVHPGAVMIIPILPDGDILLERQYRYPLARDFLEFPAGKIDAGEDPLACGQRELLEETGYQGGHWRHLTTLHPVISYSSERIEVFLAEDVLDGGGRRLDEGEFLDVFAIAPRDAMALLDQGLITDAKTVVGLLWLERLGKVSRR
jgi:ADP-ribose pyrophosphatase